MDMSALAFVVLGVLATVLSGLLITRRFPISAAIMLITVFVLLAGMYGLLDAHFAAAAQIIVYAGAIMVVFVFVIMLLNLPPEEMRYGGVTIGEWFIIALSLVAACVLGTKVGQGVLQSSVEAMLPANVRNPLFPPESIGSVSSVAGSMFTDYLWPFELVSFLILAAIVGAIVIAKKRGGDVKSA